MDYTIIYLCLLINDLSLCATLHIRALTTYMGQDQQERVGDWRDGTEWRHTHKRTLGPEVNHHCLTCVGPLPHLASPKQAEKKVCQCGFVFPGMTKSWLYKECFRPNSMTMTFKNQEGVFKCLHDLQFRCTKYCSRSLPNTWKFFQENSFIRVNYDLSS